MEKLKNLSKEQKVFIILVVIFALAIIGFLVSFYISSSDLKKKGNDYSVGDLTMKVTSSEDEDRNLIEELTSLSENYNNAVLWLKIPGTSIDTPVFQASDNDFYLRKDRDGNETKWGENFLDYECDVGQLEYGRANYIVYGHNTEVDTRFTPLLNYKMEDFYNEHKVIEVATKSELYKFEIFAVYQTTPDFYYIQSNFDNSDEFLNFVSAIKEKSMYNSDIEITDEDTILTLSTCDYSIDDGRFVIQAKLLK